MEPHRKTKRRKFTLVELLVVVFIIFILGALAAPAFLKQKKKSDMLHAVSNSRQIYLLLAEFDQDFGAYPTEAILAANTKEFVGIPNDTRTSNRYLGALIATGYIENEEAFFCKNDGVISCSSEILKSRKCGFSYIDRQSSNENGSRTLLACPMAAEGEEFQWEPFSGKAVILRIDGSVKTERISKTSGDKTKGEVKVEGGLGLFETSVDSVWRTGKGDNSFTTADILKPDLSN